MYRGFIATLFLLLVFTLSAAERPQSSEHIEDVQGLRVLNVQSVKQPEQGSIASVDVRNSDNLVSRVMRLTPGATIKEHYHPFFDEIFFVHSGALTMMLNDKKHVLRSGDIVSMPAGTIISGTNAGTEEAIVVVVWANIGKKGPLFVFGRPEQTQPKEKH